MGTSSGTRVVAWSSNNRDRKSGRSGDVRRWRGWPGARRFGLFADRPALRLAQVRNDGDGAFGQCDPIVLSHARPPLRHVTAVIAPGMRLRTICARRGPQTVPTARPEAAYENPELVRVAFEPFSAPTIRRHNDGVEVRRRRRPAVARTATTARWPGGGPKRGATSAGDHGDRSAPERLRSSASPGATPGPSASRRARVGGAHRKADRRIRRGDDKAVEQAVLQLSQRRRWLAPLALIVGALLMLFQGVKLLYTNWRLAWCRSCPPCGSGSPCWTSSSMSCTASSSISSAARS